MTNNWSTYSPITAEANANLRRLWRAQALPEVSLDHWSLEFAREVWQVVTEFVKSEETGHEDMVQFLTTLGVWDEDQREQQWAPTP